jgi:ribosomal protein S18 acetylase RimI-like enzyme
VTAAPVLRAAGAADAPAIADLLTASWQDAYAALLPPELLRDRLPALHRAAWARIAADPPAGAVVVAEDAGGLLGFCAAWLRGDECYVDNLHLRPKARGGGVGRALLGRAAAALAAQGATRAALSIIEGNDGARRFYERLGGETAAAPRPAALHGEGVLYRDIAWPRVATLVAACEAARH